jgi:hypothetical protein
MKQKVASLKRLTRLTNPCQHETKQRREKTQINKIRHKKGDITTNNNKIQRIVRECLENLYSCNVENLDEMNKFLDAYNQPKLNQDDINS